MTTTLGLWRVTILATCTADLLSFLPEFCALASHVRLGTIRAQDYGNNSHTFLQIIYSFNADFQLVQIKFEDYPDVLMGMAAQILQSLHVSTVTFSSLSVKY